MHIKYLRAGSRKTLRRENGEKVRPPPADEPESGSDMDHGLDKQTTLGKAEEAIFFCAYTS